MGARDVQAEERLGERLRQRSWAERTRKRYDEVTARVGVVDTTSVNAFIARQVEMGASDVAIRQLLAALRGTKVQGLDWALIEETHRAAKVEIRRRRTEPPTRPTMTREEMTRLLAALDHEGEAAHLFALQTFLVWRYDSLRHLRHQHVTIAGQEVSITVVKDKVMSNQWAPRCVKGVLLSLAARWPASGRWRGVMDWFVREVRRGYGGERTALNNISQSYETYLAGVREVLDRYAPRLRGVRGVGAHVARCTGACMHREDGWSAKAIMLWEDGRRRSSISCTRTVYQG